MSSESVQFIKFSGLAKPVVLVGCDWLIEGLSRVFPDWPFREIPNFGNRPILSISRDRRGFRLDGFWLRDPIVCHDEVDALSALMVEVMRAYVRQDDRLFCLRGASALFGEELIVLPRRHQSGRRLVAACLAAAGIPLFGDDLLPMNRIDGKAMAPGLAPCLSLPLPFDPGAGLRAFIDRHECLRGKNQLYLDLGEQTLVRRGIKAPVGGFVLLERKPGSEARLEPAAETEVLNQVISQDFSGETESPRIWQILSDLAARAQRYRLQYDHPEEAAELLIACFGQRLVHELSTPRSTVSLVATSQPLSLLPGYYLRKPEISVIEVNGQLFLADRNGAAIRRLDQVGNAIWSLLEEPKSIEEISGLLVTAFPDLCFSEVENDVRGLISELLASDLLNQGANAHQAEVTIN